jgi:hypothetical protein
MLGVVLVRRWTARDQALTRVPGVTILVGVPKKELRLTVRPESLSRVLLLLILLPTLTLPASTHACAGVVTVGLRLRRTVQRRRLRRPRCRGSLGALQHPPSQPTYFLAPPLRNEHPSIGHPGKKPLQRKRGMCTTRGSMSLRDRS